MSIVTIVILFALIVLLAGAWRSILQLPGHHGNIEAPSVLGSLKSHHHAAKLLFAAAVLTVIVTAVILQRGEFIIDEVPGMTAVHDYKLDLPKVALGQRLYNEPLLSAERDRSCQTCHTDGGANGEAAVRLGRSPSAEEGIHNVLPVVNVRYVPRYFWTGRHASLREVVHSTLENGSMGTQNLTDVAERLNRIPEYNRRFKSIFGEEATSENISEALEQYMLTLTTPNSRWFRHLDPVSRKTAGFSQQALAGLEVFQAVRCDRCHSGPLLTDFKYYNLGLERDTKDPGRAEEIGDKRTCGTNGDQSCLGAFRNPSLIGVSSKNLFFHNGSVRTLSEALDAVLGGGNSLNPHRDTTLTAIELEPERREDLLAFLREL